ncbi:trypsin-like [Clytia hemisphaerica]|uniref:Uncharacterized protein n=1 Tax=Clytia hemisphaerica TaxID=252671 RepID=A0A7M5V5B6_9CNID
MGFMWLFVLALPSIVTAQNCADKSAYCSQWASAGYCFPTNQWFTYMSANCPMTCLLCSPPPTAPPACQDKSPWCSSYKDYCNHADYLDYVQAECKLTCNYCHITTAPPPTTQPTQPYTGPAGKGLQKNCGHKGPSHTRIVGGTKARPGDWPWQVNIDYLYNTANPGAHCGGTLLNDEWVLSAAHCFEADPVAGRYWMRLAEHDIHSSNGWEQRFNVTELIMHPKYDANKNHDYDFALLKLDRKASFNDRVRPACIPGPKTSFPVGTECWISGWGLLKEHDLTGPKILQQAKVPLIDQSTCEQAFSHMSYPITSRMTCAGYDKKAVDSCQGDSGGPLVCKKRVNNADVWFLWGVVSWGNGCARQGSYGVYARTQYVTEWITQKAFA